MGRPKNTRYEQRIHRRAYLKNYNTNIVIQLHIKFLKKLDSGTYESTVFKYCFEVNARVLLGIKSTKTYNKPTSPLLQSLSSYLTIRQINVFPLYTQRVRTRARTLSNKGQSFTQIFLLHYELEFCFRRATFRRKILNFIFSWFIWRTIYNCESRRRCVIIWIEY